MDTRTIEAHGAAMPPGAPAPCADLPDDPGFHGITTHPARAWWDMTSKRTRLLVGIAVIAAVVPLGAVAYHRLQATRAPTWSSGAEPGAPREVQAVRVPDFAPVAAPIPAPVPVIEARIAAPPPDPLAELKQLAREAATAPPAVAPRPDTDQASIAAMTTQLAVLVRENLANQVNLAKRQAALEADLRSEIADLRERVAMAEARTAYARTMAQPDAAPGPATQRVAATPRAAAAPSYRVQAAGPSSAYLAVSNPAPGQKASIEVRPGEDLPGLGKVTRIAQEGTAWKVYAERGIVTQ